MKGERGEIDHKEVVRKSRALSASRLCRSRLGQLWDPIRFDRDDLGRRELARDRQRARRATSGRITLHGIGTGEDVRACPSVRPSVSIVLLLLAPAPADLSRRRIRRPGGLILLRQACTFGLLSRQRCRSEPFEL